MVHRTQESSDSGEGITLRIPRPSFPGRIGLQEKERRDPRTLRLGEWLVQKSLITRRDLFDALNLCFANQCRVGDAIVHLGRLPRACVEREAQAHYECSALLNGQPLGVPRPPRPRSLPPTGAPRRVRPPSIPEDA